MACVNIINSTNVGLFLDGTLIAYSTDARLSITHDVRDITSKDSGGWADFMEGLRRWEVSASAWYQTAASPGFAAIFAKIATREVLTVKVASTGTEEGSQPIMGQSYQGSAWVRSADLSSPGQEDNGQFEASFQGCGALTET